MNLPLYIARRYLFSKKQQNVINIISLISVIGVAVGSMALVVVLSVFNGFDGLIHSLFGSFDPDLKILPARGKTFIPDSIAFDQIRHMEGVAFYTEIIEENALLKYGNRERTAIVKGVGEEFSLMTGIDTMMVEGSFVLDTPEQHFAVMGYGVAMDLGIGLTFVDPIKFYVPKRKGHLTSNPVNALNIEYLYPAGFFVIQQDFDSQYVLVPLEFARKLFNYPKAVSAIELKLTNRDQQDEIQHRIKDLLGDKFVVKNQFQLHATLFKMMQSEKAAIFFILAFILVIASFNVIGSLTMLILDKKSDIATLTSMGANQKTIERIFLMEGMLISTYGAIMGITLGTMLCWLQKKFALIQLQGENFIVSAYPVDLQIIDLLYIAITVILIGYLACRFPVRYITKRFLKLD